MAPAGLGAARSGIRSVLGVAVRGPVSMSAATSPQWMLCRAAAPIWPAQRQEELAAVPAAQRGRGLGGQGQSTEEGALAPDQVHKEPLAFLDLQRRGCAGSACLHKLFTSLISHSSSM